jgi:hypothetical protein
MVRGSAIRVTELGRVGQMLDPIRFATSKTVANVVINEVAEATSNEVIRNDADEIRVHFIQNGQMIRHTVDIDFLRCDPAILSLTAGVPVQASATGQIVGFNADTKRPAASFALEVWSKLDGQRCADGTPLWGYTMFPFLKGGYLSGFKFANGLVSFNLRGAQSRRMNRWGVGPFDLEGVWQRLPEVVSRNAMYKQMLTTATPPVQVDGEQVTTDVLDGGTATLTSADVVDNGSAANPGTYVIDGGRAL